MTWIISNWRLKLLALVLTIGLLGAVAFSENPVEFRTLNASVDYVPPPGGVVLLGQVTSVSVQVTGLADTVSALKPENVEVRADVSKLRAGVDTTVTGQVRVLVPNVSATSSTVPIHVVTDSLVDRTLDVEVRTPNTVAGWKVDQDPKKTLAQCPPDPTVPCRATVAGPATVLNRLKAFVNIQQPINNNLLTFPSQPVRFERDGQAVELGKVATLPAIRVDPAIVTVQVSATTTSAQRSVAVSVPVTGRPACGFSMTGLTIGPGNGIVTISGPADVVTSQTSVSVDPIDVSNATANVTRDLPVHVPDQVTSQPATIRVTVTIQKQFDCAAPTPTPSPTTSPPKP